MPYGSNLRRGLAILLLVLLERSEEAARAPFRRQLSVLLETTIEARVALDEGEREFEAACFDDLEEVVDARGDGSLLPPCDQRSRAPAQLREFVLRQAGSRPRLPDEISTPHSES